MLGKPVIRGTRTPVALILRKLGEGASEQDLLNAYPHLKSQDIRAAMSYAAETLFAKNYHASHFQKTNKRILGTASRIQARFGRMVL